MFPLPSQDVFNAPLSVEAILVVATAHIDNVARSVEWYMTMLLRRMASVAQSSKYYTR